VQPAWRREGTLYVLGVDGLTLDVIEPMLAQGDLPNLARLVAEGCWGRLRTISPTVSPVIWTSISTGCHQRLHGIDGFHYYSMFGRRLSGATLRRARKVGLKALLKGLKHVGLMPAHLFDARDVRRKRFWEILSDAGEGVGLVNWYHTWPAAPVNGFVISDRLVHWRVTARRRRARPEGELTFPPELLEEADQLSLDPEHVPLEELRRFANVPDTELQEFLRAAFARHDVRSELRFIAAQDLSCWRLFDHCLSRFTDLTVAAAYLRGTDLAQHAAAQYVPWFRDVPVSDEERRRYGQTVLQAYRRADGFIGSVLARMGPEDTLLVISDHGCGYQKDRGNYGHTRGEPPGVLYAYGREFARGRQIADASIYDVAPTLLRICGFPSAREMEGKCLEDILAPEFRREHPPLEPIEGYGPPERRPCVSRKSRELDKEVMDHLRGLGYSD
jgi:hypothetical protein